MLAAIVNKTVRIANRGTPATTMLVKSAKPDGGLICKPPQVRDGDGLNDEARRQRRDDRRMRNAQIREVVGEPDGKPRGDCGGEAEDEQSVVAAHRRHRDRAGKPDIRRQRQVDVAQPEGDDEHLAYAAPFLILTWTFDCAGSRRPSPAALPGST